jgi:putative transposase
MNMALQGAHVEQVVGRVSAREEKVLGETFWARGYFCATGQMTEEMIKQYLAHHFEPRSNDDFKMEPD